MTASLSASQVGVYHASVPPNLVGRAVHENPSFVHHDDPVAGLHDEGEVVLDDQEGDAPFAERRSRTWTRRSSLQGGVNAGHRLVEKDETRRGHEDASEVEELALAARERSETRLRGVSSRTRRSNSCAWLSHLPLAPPGRPAADEAGVEDLLSE